MIHGVLHLLGNKDKKPKDKVLMRKKEDDCLIFLQSPGK
ncbi:MAG TPA: rRNA maturation RNAse YbeY [Bacteroidales bacterium]